MHHTKPKGKGWSKLTCDKCGRLLGYTRARELAFGDRAVGTYVAKATAEIKCECGAKTVWFGLGST